MRLNNRFFAGLFEKENIIRFDSNLKNFWIYNESNGMFTESPNSVIAESISKRVLDISREKKDFKIEKSIRVSFTTDVIKSLEGILLMKNPSFEKPHNIIHCKNGVLKHTDNDLRFTEFSPFYHSRNQISIHFDPKAECPQFLEFLSQSMESDDVELFQKYFGMTLLGHNFAQRLLILYGIGGAGKTTLVKIVQGIIDPINCYELRTQHLGERFESFRYKGKILLTGADVPGDFLMNEGASHLKAIVGGDPISVEGKGLNDSFNIEGNFPIMLTCNSRLRIRLQEDEKAWKRRLLIIEFKNNSIQKKIPDYHRVLISEEGSGILNWALQGLIKIQQDFKIDGELKLSDSQLKRVDSLLSESDSLRRFLTECVQKDTESSLTKKEIFEKYGEYCAEQSWNPLPEIICRRQLSGLMLQHFQVSESCSIKRDEGTQRGFRKVKFKTFEVPND
jgi:putative DNA primase/helicase